MLLSHLAFFGAVEEIPLCFSIILRFGDFCVTAHRRAMAFRFLEGITMYVQTLVAIVLIIVSLGKGRSNGEDIQERKDGTKANIMTTGRVCGGRKYIYSRPRQEREQEGWGV